MVNLSVCYGTQRNHSHTLLLNATSFTYHISVFIPPSPRIKSHQESLLQTAFHILQLLAGRRISAAPITSTAGYVCWWWQACVAGRPLQGLRNVGDAS